MPTSTLRTAAPADKALVSDQHTHEGKGKRLGWPVPPYPVYAPIEPGSEPVACELEGLDGIVRSGLVMPLMPTEQGFQMRPDRGHTWIQLALSEFACLSLKPPIRPHASHDADAFAEILSYRATVDYALQLRSGRTLSGQTVGHVDTCWGLFLFKPVDAHGGVERMFVPHNALASVRLGEPIGEVLVSQKSVTAQQVAHAARTQQSLRRRKLGDYLVDAAVVTPEQLVQALEQQAKMPMVLVGEALLRMGFIDQNQLNLALERQKIEHQLPLGQLLVKMGFLTRDQLNTALACKMGYPMVDVLRFPVEPAALGRIPLATAKRLMILPLLARGNLTVVAAADPTRRDVLEELEFLVQGRVTAALADELQIKRAITMAYGKPPAAHPLSEEASPSSTRAIGQQPEQSSGELLASMERTEHEWPEPDDGPQIAQSDNTLVRLINTMICEAHEGGVSDIHVETQPGRAKVRIRFRKDGVLSLYLELPHTYRAALVARLKIMADLDISERRKPQDGKIDFKKFSPQHRLELRIATIPTSHGLEDVVMRLLSSAKPLPMDKLGLSQSNLDQLCHAVSRPYGMVLCVGPTGSGKTTTLHSVLGYLNTPERKIWTAEDPIEITQPELRQVQVNPRIGWTFAQALRSFLRADPDIIMVGEIRDAETAQIAIEASLTGHLVLSTLHTNSAAETVTRLVDMGMDPFNFADSLLAVLAQRLARRLCQACRRPEPASADFLDELLDEYLRAFPPAVRPSPDVLLAQWQATYGTVQRYRAMGCSHCNGTGLSGRVGLHELLQVTPAIRRLIQTGARSEDIQQEAFQGGLFQTLRQDGMTKVLAGQISIEEVRANSNA